VLKKLSATKVEPDSIAAEPSAKQTDYLS